MSADGRFVATWEPEGVFVLDRQNQTRQLLPNTQFGDQYEQAVYAPVISADGKIVYAFETSPFRKLKRYWVGTTESEAVGLVGPIQAVSSNGQFVLAEDYPMTWKNMNSGRVYHVIGGVADMDPTGRFIFFADPSNVSNIALKDFDTETEVSRLITTTSLSDTDVHKVFVSGDGLRYIVSASVGRTYIYSRVTGARIQLINEYMDILAVSYDGKQAVLNEKFGGNWVPRQRVFGATTSVGLITSTADYGSPLTLRLGPPILVMDKPNTLSNNLNDVGGAEPMSLMTAWER